MGLSGGSHFEGASGHPAHQIGPILLRASNIWNDPSEVPSNVKYSVDRFTQWRSQKQLQMMTIVLLTGVVFFSTMIYFLEKDEKGSPFTSIPAAYW